MDSSLAPSPTPNSTGLVRAVAIAALVAGTMDYTAAITNYLLNGGKEPIKIAWYIASSLLGRETAYAGGYATAALGIFLHYVIATSWTVLFFLLYPRFAVQRQNMILDMVLIAIGYGFFVWGMMNLVLVPLTLIKTGPLVRSDALIQACILMLCIGGPLVVLARRHYTKAN